MEESSPHPSPYFREYRLLIEYKHLRNFVAKHFGGIYVIPSPRTLFEWDGVIFIRQGIFRHGIFKFKLLIPESYPSSPPTIRFLSHPPGNMLFHPKVSPDTGDVTPDYVTELAPLNLWDPEKSNLIHVLRYIKSLFYENLSDTPTANPQAAHLFLQDPESFRGHVWKCVHQSFTLPYERGSEEHSLSFIDMKSVLAKEQDCTEKTQLLTDIIKAFEHTSPHQEDSSQGSHVSDFLHSISSLFF